MTHGLSSEPIGWARVWPTAHPFARPTPRAGAWYPILGEASGERLVLEIRGKHVAIQRRLLEIRDERPKVFTLIVRTREAAAAAGAPISRIYAVCPVCTHRVQIVDQQTEALCPQCGHQAEIAWWETT
jgi:hypothetical protein